MDGFFVRRIFFVVLYWVGFMVRCLVWDVVEWWMECRFGVGFVVVFVGVVWEVYRVKMVVEE